MHDDTTDAHLADADLVLRTRSGDTEAFGELWRRHYPSGLTVARSVTSSIDADDLVQESYARIYQAILKGGGPNGSFRAYLFTSIRNTAAAWGRSRRETAIDELDTVADPASTDQAAEEALDRSLTAQAFRSLPSRWQEVLWYSEIEQMKSGEIAPLLGMTAGAVSQLAFRAREGLREAWIQAHLRSAGQGSECHWAIEHLGAYSRGNLGARVSRRLEAHLEECARCLIVAAEAKDVSNRLALVLLPLVLGVSGAAGYVASLQGDGTPIVALAAMPSSVVEGAVVVTGAGAAVGTAGAAATGGAAGGVATAGSASTGAASGGASSGSSGPLTGIGALVGAGSAALVVAGVVAAVGVVPGMLNGAPATSQPGATSDDPTSISSEVAPDKSIFSEQPVVIEVDEEEPPADAPETVQPPTDEDTTPVEPTDSVPQPSSRETVAPTKPTLPAGPGTNPGTTDPGTTDPGTTDPGTTDPGTTDPGTTDPGTTDPGTTDPGTTDPGTTDPGTTDPGTTDPGTTDPGTTDPGTTDPGTTDPGTTDPGTTDPGTTDPGTTDPALSWGGATFWTDSELRAHVGITVTGPPSTTVQVWIDGVPARGDEIVLDSAGTGTVDLRPALKQLVPGTSIGFRAVVDDIPGSWRTTTLGELGWAAATDQIGSLNEGPAVADEPAVEAVPAPEETTAEDPAPVPDPAPATPLAIPARAATEETSAEVVPTDEDAVEGVAAEPVGSIATDATVTDAAAPLVD